MIRDNPLGLRVQCSSCGARKGKPCHTVTGRPTGTHAERVRLAKSLGELATAVTAGKRRQTQSNRKKPSNLVRAAVAYPCPFCEAASGEPCRTPRGRRSIHVHVARMAIVKPSYASAGAGAGGAKRGLRLGASEPSDHGKALLIPCPSCGADVGAKCRWPKGGRSRPYPHNMRKAAADPRFAKASR